jgi:hypothetical protein
MESAGGGSSYMTVKEKIQNQKRSRFLLRSPATIGMVLIILAGLALSVRFVLAIGPYNTAQSYCDALTGQHYDTIYDTLLSNETRVSVDKALFMQAEHLADQSAGLVTRCEASLLNIDIGLSSATAHITQYRNKQAIGQSMHLAGGSWKISDLPDANIFPLLRVGRSFCMAIAHQDYKTAYQFFSSAITDRLASDQYIQAIQERDDFYGKVDACDISDLSLSKDEHQATLTISVHRQSSNSTNTQVQLDFAQQNNGKWAIIKLPQF